MVECSSTARRSTPRASGQSAIAARSWGRPARRGHRYDFWPAQPPPPHARISTASRARPTRGTDHRRTRRDATGATTRPPTCCTTPLRQVLATTSSGRFAGRAGPLSVRLPTTSRSAPTDRAIARMAHGDTLATPACASTDDRPTRSLRHRLFGDSTRHRPGARGGPSIELVGGPVRSTGSSHDQGRQRGSIGSNLAAHRAVTGRPASPSCSATSGPQRGRHDCSAADREFSTASTQADSCGRPRLESVPARPLAPAAGELGPWRSAGPCPRVDGLAPGDLR